MRMKNTMPPYPNTHAYFYNGRTKILREADGEYVEFDETVRRSWERQLWQQGFRPLDEEGNVIMKQSPQSAPMGGASNDDAADIDHKESIDPSVLAGNNAEFQELHADELKQIETTQAEAEESEDTPADPPTDANAFGLTEEEAAAHTESNAVDDSGPATDAASVEEAPILAVEEENNEKEETKSRSRRRKAADKE